MKEDQELRAWTLLLYSIFHKDKSTKIEEIIKDYQFERLKNYIENGVYNT